MASDNIQVAIRVRQLIQKELTSGLKSHWSVHDNSICCDESDANGRKPTPYIFDRVFDDTTVTVDIFDEICKPIVDSALAGFNGTIFAYGQSSSGKTFTMSGSRVQRGIISLAVDEIFNYIDNIPDREFLIRVGYLEIYNEKVSDLLSAEDNHLKLQEDTAHNIQVVGLTEEVVQDGSGVYNVLKKGDAKRHTAETKQNDRSSRSHCILRFVIESREAGHEDDAVNVSNLYFVDLAGSEKANDNSGDRFREGCAINKSLFTLGMVIRKLSGDTSQQHVSFRDSKLTRILQNALGGNSKTAIICTITPAHVEESDGTLKFASRAKNIKNKAVVNEIMSDTAMLKKYRLTIKALERQIKDMNDTNINLEKAELEKRLQVKEQAESQQAEMIAKLQTMIVTSGTGHVGSEPPIKKRRRETWCPGKAKREFHGLHAISEISPPKLYDLRDKTLPFTARVQDNTVFEEEEDSFQLLENVLGQSTNSSNNSQKQESPDPNETIQTNQTLKQLFQLQDDHEVVLEELRKKDEELKELQEFTNIEREMESDEIKKVKEDLKKLTEENSAMRENMNWLEEELMKSQNERKNLRLAVQSTNAKLNAAEDGSGISEKSKQLTVSETRVSDLNSDLEIQKSQYEFAIQQMKHKLEVYTTMLEEKGVDYNSIKARVSSQSDEIDQLNTEKNNEVAELQHKHEQEINDLRNEIDMLVLAVEKEKQQTVESKKEFELEFEDQKTRFQKDVDEAKEEIEIYQQMLEEEKAKKMNTKQNGEVTVSVDDARLTELQSEFELQKQTYEAEITRLQNEVIKQRELLESSKEVSEEENAVNEVKTDEALQEKTEVKAEYEKKMDEMKAEYEKKMDGMKAEYENEMKAENENEMKAEYEKKMDEMKAEYENEMKAEYEKKMDEMKAEYENEMKAEYENEMKAEYEKKMDEMKAEYEKKMDEMKAEHEIQTTQLAEKLELEKNSETEMEAEHQKQMNDLKAIHEQLETELKEQLKENLADLNARVKESKECQTDKIERHVNFDYSAELENQKERYEGVITELTEERDAYHAVLEEKSMNESQTSDIVLLKTQYDEQIFTLKSEIDRYKELCDNINKSKSDVDDERLSSTEMGEEFVKQLKEQVQEFKSEADKYKELFESEKAKLRRSEGFSFTIDESICAGDSIVTDMERNTNGGMDLQKEMLQAEIDKLRESHECEVTELKEEISKYVKMLENKQSQNMSDEGPNNSHHDDVVNRENVDEVNQKFEDEIKELRAKIHELTNELEVEKTKNISSGEEVLDLRSEMLRAENEEAVAKYIEEIEELKSKLTSYEEQLLQKQTQGEGEEIEARNLEILELKSKLTSYEELLQQEKDKMERILESVDERRTELEKHDSMKSMYEGKIKELNEDIRIYMDLLEDGKSQQTDGEQSEKEAKDNMSGKYLEEIERMKTELEKFTNLYESEKEKNESSRENTAEQNTVSVVTDNEKLQAHIDELEEKHKRELEFMKEEFAKFAEQHLQEKGDERECDIEEMKSLYEKEIDSLKKELEDIKEKFEQAEGNKTESDCFDLRSELLKSELDGMKQTHKSEIESLQSELEKLRMLQECDESATLSEDLKITYEKEIIELKEKLETFHTNSSQTCIQDSKNVDMDLQSELSEDLKLRYEKEISELKDKLEAFHTNSLQTCIQDSENVGMDLQSEMLRAEIETLKENHAEEIGKLQEQIQPGDLKETNDVSLNTSNVQVEDSMPETDEVKQLRLDLETCQKCLEERKGKILQLEETIESSKKQREVYETTIEEMQDDLSHMTTQLQQLPGDIEILQAANARLKQEKLDLINARERFSHMSDEHEGTIQELQETLKELQDNIQQTEDENVRLKSRVEELEHHITIGKGMLASKDEEIRKLASDLEEQRESLDTELQEKVREMTEYVTELEVKVNEGEELLKQANEKLEELEQCEAQFSDKILNLESDVEMYKVKEEELSKVCTEYEEKIVLLETDIESVKVKNVELESTSSEQEKRIEGLTEHLELAQNKDMELKEIQCRYQDKITELETELKQSLSCLKEIESERNELQNKFEHISREVEEVKEELKKESEKKEEIEKEKELSVFKMEQQVDESKEKLHDMEEKLDIYAETVKELQEEIKLNEEESELLRSRVTELEADSKVAGEALSENDMLKVKLESVELELTEKLEYITKCETDIESLKDKLALTENTTIGKEELDRLEAEFSKKVKAAEEKVKVIEGDRDEIKNLAESLKIEKEAVEKRLTELEEVKLSLEEDKLQLEKGLHPTALKYHSLPENIDWENRWNEFVREEKKKRVAVFATVRSLKKEVQKEQDRQKNAYEEALEAVYEKEQNTEVYKKLEEQIKSVSDEANTLYYDLEKERNITKELREKIEKLGKEGHSLGTTKINFMTEDHPCKYKLEGFSATEKLQTAQEEHFKRIAQYEETIQQYDARIARMKNEMRRYQSNMDTTFDGRSAKMPKFDVDPQPKPSPAHTPCSTPSSQDNVTYGNSMSGGIVDHFKVCITEAENKRLKQEMDKQKKKMSRVEDLERENTKVKEELQNFRKKHHRVEEIEKENLHLKEELKKATCKGNNSHRDTSLVNGSSRHPLGDMFVTASETVTDSLTMPPSPRKEPRYKVPDLNPIKKEDTLIKECQEEVNNCKSS